MCEGEGRIESVRGPLVRIMEGYLSSMTIRRRRGVLRLVLSILVGRGSSVLQFGSID